MGKLVVILAAALGTIMVVGPVGLALAMGALIAPVATTHDTINCGGSIASTGQWRVPFVDVAYTITSGFGTRSDPFTGASSYHNGVDLATGQSPVVATSNGTVIWAGDNANGYGNHVIVDHGAGITTMSAHLANIEPGVTAGATVQIGQRLGLEGTTGRSTGVHLHFTMTVDGAEVDPAAFLQEHGAPLNGQPMGPSVAPVDGAAEGGIGFELPQPEVRKDSLTNEPLPIPAVIEQFYRAAATEYGLPWTLLAGIGMAETAHGRITATSSAGAQGLMQFMPATFTAYGIDGDDDGTADILNSADSIYSAANYLVASGALKGADGIEQALFAYNHADWYVGDVLYYAHAYGGGTVMGTLTDCPPGQGNPNLTPLAADRVAQLVAWAEAQVGKAYVTGGVGPDAYDCSGLVQTGFARVGVTMPRTAQAQRDWLAAGNGYQVSLGQEQPGDVLFTSSYLGPNQIGHTGIITDPSTGTSVEAATTELGVIHNTYTGYQGMPIFELWRVGNLVES